MSTIDSRSKRSFAGSEPSLTPEGGVSIDELSGEKLHAHVRYASIDENGEFYQESSLRSVSEHTPENANFVSTGIYLLTSDQEDRLHEGVPPKEIQNECNDDGRVVYSVIAETDELRKDGSWQKGKTEAECIEALKSFAEEWLSINEYEFYFSGNRSIHLETDQYVTAEGLSRLKEEAEEFNQQSEVKLDTSVYNPNSVFRIEGAEHRKGDGCEAYKREISESGEIYFGDELEKQTFHNLPTPEEHIGDSHLDNDRWDRSIQNYPYYTPNSHTTAPQPHCCPGDVSIEPIPQEFDNQLLGGYLKNNEDQDYLGLDRTPDYEEIVPFSPYKKSGGEKGRSVIVAKQVDSPLCLMENEGKAHIPAEIKSAVGGGDGSYNRSDTDTTLIELSSKDYAKWDYESGDYVVIIGGRSGSSRIFNPTEKVAGRVHGKLKREGREAALEFLSESGYEVGESGYNGDRSTVSSSSGETEAMKIKHGIENGTREKSYDNILSVVCRLLRLEGWDAAYEWCRDVFGSGFDSEETYDRLKGIAEFWDDLDHVNVPERGDH